MYLQKQKKILRVLVVRNDPNVSSLKFKLGLKYRDLPGRDFPSGQLALRSQEISAEKNQKRS